MLLVFLLPILTEFKSVNLYRVTLSLIIYFGSSFLFIFGDLLFNASNKKKETK